MKIGILSDTHLNDFHLKMSVYAKLLRVLTSVFADVDHIIHAGDVVTPHFLEDLQKIAPVSMVRGNMDETPRWPKKILLTFEGIKIGIAHRPEDIILFQHDEIQVYIHGHTHIAKIQTNSEGMLLINPGSLSNPRVDSHTSRFFQKAEPRPSIALLSIEDDIVSALIKKL
jgi:hypothetical protein